MATHSYWTWFDVDVASGLNAHLRYLVDTLGANSCLYVQYLGVPVEIPIYKRCFKTKPTVLSALIRTSEVGREELQDIREALESDGFLLQLRRSPKKRYLNQVKASVPTDDSLYPLKVRQVLQTVVEALGQRMPTKVVIGYHQREFSQTLPGDFHDSSRVSELASRLGKTIGLKLRND